MRDDDGEHVRRTSMYPLQSPMIWIVFFFNGGHWKRLRDDTVHDTSWNNSAGAMPSVTTCGFSERLAVPERWRASALTDVSDISCLARERSSDRDDDDDQSTSGEERSVWRLERHARPSARDDDDDDDSSARAIVVVLLLSVRFDADDGADDCDTHQTQGSCGE